MLIKQLKYIVCIFTWFTKVTVAYMSTIEVEAEQLIALIYIRNVHWNVTKHSNLLLMFSRFRGNPKSLKFQVFSSRFMLSP